MEAIVAVSDNWGIGNGGQLLFRIRADQQRFRELTLGRTVIMGRKTVETLPGGMGLARRRNIVLSRQPGLTIPRAEVFTAVGAALSAAGADAVVIGGESVYRLLLPLCSRVRLTRVLAHPEADAFFPDLDADPAWQVSSAGPLLEEDGLAFQYVDYVRR